MKTKKRENSGNWSDRGDEPPERKDGWFYFNVRYSVRKRRKFRWPRFGLFPSNSGSGTHGEPSLVVKLLLAVGRASEESSAHARVDSSLRASMALQVQKTSRILKKTKTVRLELNGRCSNNNSDVTIKKRTTEFLQRCSSSIRQLSIRDRGGSLKESAAAGEHDEQRQGDDAGTFLSRSSLRWEDRLKFLPLKFTSVLGAMSVWTVIYLLGVAFGLAHRVISR